jgi:hypothetical protein
VVEKFSAGSAKNARYARECPSRRSSLSILEILLAERPVEPPSATRESQVADGLRVF